MTTSHEHADMRAARRLEIEALIKGYPDIPANDLTTVKHWFHCEASAFDVAILSSNEDLREAYMAFRKDHIDRFTAQDVAKATLFIAATVTVIALFMWRVM